MCPSRLPSHVACIGTGVRRRQVHHSLRTMTPWWGWWDGAPFFRQRQVHRNVINRGSQAIKEVGLRLKEE